jgi:hypothetical protein
VQEESAAARGGHSAKGDLILKIGDEVVGDAPTFAAVIASKSGGTPFCMCCGGIADAIELTVNLQPK